MPLLSTAITPPILTLLFSGLINVFVLTLVDWTLLLHLNHLGLTSATSTSFYIRLVSLSLLVPIPANILLTHFQTLYPASSLSLFHFLIAVSLIILSYTKSPKVFALAYALLQIAPSLRIARIALFAKLLRKNVRTSWLAINQLLIPVGAIISPVVWLLLQTWQGEMQFRMGFVLNRFTLAYVICAVMHLAMVHVAAFGLAEFRKEEKIVAELDAEEDSRSGIGYGAVDVVGRQKFSPVVSGAVKGIPSDEAKSESDLLTVGIDGGIVDVDLEGYRMSRFIFYTVVMMGTQLTTMLFLASFQPVLINVYQASEAAVGQVFALIAVMALIPPVMITVLSGLLSDRAIMVVGLSLKAIGILCVLPLWETSMPLFVAGFVIITKASMFFVPTTFSLYTKVMGKLCAGMTSVGWLWSIASAAPALVQLVVTDNIVKCYGTWKYGLLAVPWLISFVLVLSPLGWRWLDPNAKITRQLNAYLSRT